MKNYWNIGGIGIQKGAYPTEQVESALERIRAFRAKTTITMESQGRGYGTIKIKIGNNVDKEYDYTPYGIDIEMMLGYIAECEPLIAAANQGSSDNRYSHFHNSSSPSTNERQEAPRQEEAAWLPTNCMLQ